MTRAILTLLIAVLSGCAHHPNLFNLSQTSRPCPPLSQDHELALSMVQELSEQGRQHAALAHLERLPQQHPAVQLRQAKLLRTLGHPSAQAHYQSLQRSCLHGYAEQGLGQLAAQAKDYPKAFEHLSAAAQAEPADADIRNDLGWVALHLNDLTRARFELLTALELAPENPRIASNVLILLYRQNKPKAALAMANKLGLSAEQLAEARQYGQRLHSAQNTPIAARLSPIIAQPSAAQLTAP